ncbi:phospholipase B1, membrane-associated [Astyanax mexicanus]|uniref:phospholipase B1, membrane-associated n=1 Tax=Astyanax mexicanus TaxID=7994 RepID=UPI0020CAC4BD|nr:phospholipase B1, membrane-associated [Astyanax mexicanus]
MAPRPSAASPVPLLVLNLLLGLSSESSAEFPQLCSRSEPSAVPPSSVHALRPGDVSVVSVLGLSAKHRSEELKTLQGLSDILSIFNPDVKTVLPEQRGLLKEAEELAHSLTGNEWKLLLLLVSVDELCICPGQTSSAVNSAALSVEKALDQLHNTLDHALVHVVVWGGQVESERPSHDGTCKCQYDGDSSSGVEHWYRLERAALKAVLQESVDGVLRRRGLWSDREDFSAVLQSSPTHTDYTDAGDSWRALVELWGELLQPVEAESGLEGRGLVSFPCPSQERPYLLTQRNSPSQPEIHQSPSRSALRHTRMGTSLSCPHHSPSPSVPTSVHTLRPADIKVVGAIGDSLTAGNGIGAAQNNLLGIIREYRGLAWSIGGDNSLSSVTTLPNLLREFNPSLTGFSTGSGKATTTQAFLNQAVAGAKSQDLVSQTRALINRMQSDSRIDFENDWKVITVFIGGNDLCASCENPEYFSASNFANNIRNALDVLHTEVPRALVNLVEVIYIIPLRQLHLDSSLGCPTWLVRDICPCVVNPAEGSSELEELININREYQSVTRDLVNSGRYDTRSDFSVVLQPFLRDVVLPLQSNGKPDRSFFAPDCFHLSQKSQALMARSLWNNMLESVGSKTAILDIEEGVTAQCPSSSSSYFTTSLNSQSVYQSTINTTTQTPETQPPETQPPETQTPVTQPPETQPPETQPPETQPPETQTPETQTPETQTPETQTPETQTPETQTPVTQPPVTLPPNWGSKFSCKNTEPSDTVPTSVHRLRPGDVDVVAALGDSLTAGFGAKANNIIQLLNEERGVSWSIGGDDTLETVTTIPNILKKFNRNVFGFSKGRSKRPNGFNMAVSGAKASGIPGQVRDLIEALRNSTSVNFQQDWKLVTLFIGGNDLCQYCKDRDALSPKKYIGHIRDALDMLYNEVPRVLVNFVEILEIEDLRKVTANTLGCSMQGTLCPCFLNPEENSEELYEMKRINRALQMETERLVYGGRYDKRDDFAVVLQPFFQNSVVPMGTNKQPDLSFFSVDCFHFSERGHAQMAIALWNNMLEPVGSKQSYNNFTHDPSKIHCPSEEHPYIFTLGNTFSLEPTEGATTTTTSTATTTEETVLPVTPENRMNTMPSWTAGLLVVVSLLIGVATTWLVMHCRERGKRNQKLSSLEMKGTCM